MSIKETDKYKDFMAFLKENATKYYSQEEFDKILKRVNANFEEGYFAEANSNGVIREFTIAVFLLDTASSGNIEKAKTDLLSYTGLDAVLCRENIGNSYYAKELQDALEESIRRDYPKTGYSPEEIEKIVAEMKEKAEKNKQAGTVKLDEMQGANQPN